MFLLNFIHLIFVLRIFAPGVYLCKARVEVAFILGHFPLLHLYLGLPLHVLVSVSQ